MSETTERPTPRPTTTPPGTGRLEVRVRYPECDPMGVAHHATYPVWFEMGRTDLLRDAAGHRYRDLEAQGVFFAIARLSIRYKRPARYDDLLVLNTKITGVGRAKVEHAYELFRDGELLATAETTLACLDRDGRLQPIPEGLF